MKNSLIVVCLATLLLVVQINSQSLTFNFPYTRILNYGVGHGTDETVMNYPYDFAVSATGNPVVGDIGSSQVFQFFRTYLSSYNATSTASYGQVYDLIRNGDTYYALTKQNSQNNLYSTRDFVTVTKINTASIGVDPRGLAYYAPSDTLFISDYGNNTILAYTLATFTLQRTYGSTASSPSQSSLNGPFRVTTDNAGVWVSDQINNRVLHFPFNSANADIVLGQRDFGRNPQGNVTNPSTVIRPYALAFDTVRNALYVSDASARIIRFNGPFATGQNSTGLLDTANDFAAQNIVNLRLFANSTGDGSTRLLFLDNTNVKVTSGVVA